MPGSSPGSLAPTWTCAILVRLRVWSFVLSVSCREYPLGTFKSTPPPPATVLSRSCPCGHVGPICPQNTALEEGSSPWGAGRYVLIQELMEEPLLMSSGGGGPCSLSPRHGRGVTPSHPSHSLAYQLLPHLRSLSFVSVTHSLHTPVGSLH